MNRDNVRWIITLMWAGLALVALIRVEGSYRFIFTFMAVLQGWVYWMDIKRERINLPGKSALIFSTLAVLALALVMIVI